MTPEELKKLLDDGFTSYKAHIEKVEKEVKQMGKISEETETEAKALKLKMDTIEKSLDLIDSQEKRIKELEAKSARPGGGHDTPLVKKSRGVLFTESKAFEKMQGNSTDTFMIEHKDISSGSTSAGPLAFSYRDLNVYQDPEYTIFVRDILKSVPVQDGSVDITRELAFTNNAAMQTAELAALAQSELTYSIENMPVRTIGHFVISSRQILADAPRLAALIDSRLQYGMKQKIDAQLLYGDGTGTNLTGLFIDTSVSNLGLFPALTTVTPTLMIEKIRSAITVCSNFGYRPNYVLVNPTDWETMELGKGTDGHYLFATVTMGGEPKLWAVPVIATSAVVADDFIVGDFTMGATVYDRQQASIRISESHASLFIENGVAIMGDERLTLGIELPHAFTKGSFAVTP